MLLTVTLYLTTSIEIAFMAAVSPARGADDNAISGRGVVTMADVILTIRPNLRSIIAGSTACVSCSGAIMLRAAASDQSSGLMAAIFFGTGPSLLLTRISGIG